MASLAISFAIASSKIAVAVIEADEFPDIAQRYNVRGVPRTVINGTDAIEGATPPDVLIDKVLAASVTQK
jgi:predicted DsbA family dithiol-disulfide isomerase